MKRTNKSQKLNGKENSILRGMKTDLSQISLSFILILAILPFFALNSEAFGVGPSTKRISFAPGQVIEDELFLMNNEKKETRIGVYTEGDFKENIEFEKTFFDISANDMMKSIPYRLEFPTKAPTPGEHELRIVIREFPKEDDIEGTTVKASMAVMAKIKVKVPYPGKYAEGKMFISDAEDMDKPTTFTIMVYNYGTEQIAELKGEVKILSPTGEEVGSAETNTKSANPKEEVRLDAKWPKEVNKGTYNAEAKIRYDEKDFTISKPFDLGAFTIDLSDIKVENFRLGDVAKFDISLMNNWNKKVDGVYSEIIIDDDHGNEMARSKTAAIDIPAGETGQLEGYWYTADVMPGLYHVKLIIHYGKKTTQKVMSIEVDTNEITFLGEGVGYAVSAEEEEEMTTQGLLIMLIILVVILLIIMNVLWFYFLTKKYKQRGKE